MRNLSRKDGDRDRESYHFLLPARLEVKTVVCQCAVKERPNSGFVPFLRVGTGQKVVEIQAQSSPFDLQCRPPSRRKQAAQFLYGQCPRVRRIAHPFHGIKCIGLRSSRRSVHLLGL